MRTKHITNWETWKKLCLQNEIDPYKFVDFGIDMGGGNSINYEYDGDTPKKEIEKVQCSCGRWISIEATSCICELEKKEKSR